MIYTFYSFKGGVGRSMALANTAYLLYRQGLKVIIVDFDLEAPGLERFFQLPDAENQPADIQKRRGLIDMLVSYQESFKYSSFLPPIEVTSSSSSNKFKLKHPPPRLFNFMVPIYSTQPNGGYLYIIPAGKRDGKKNLNQYNQQVLNFNWKEFYQEYDGLEFLDWFRQELEIYSNVVLVDSPNGINNMVGLCTHQLADLAVGFIPPIDGNIEETQNLAKSLSNPKLIAEDRNQRPIDLLFVPSRVETGEKESLKEFRAKFINAFSSFVPEAIEFDHQTFNNLTIPNVPFYNYYQSLAVYNFQQDSLPTHKLLVEPYEQLTEILVKFYEQKINYSWRNLPDSVTSSSWEQKDKNLEDNLLLARKLQLLEDDLAMKLQLLQQYEEDLSFTDDPRERDIFRREIQRQKEVIAGYNKEYRELAQKPQAIGQEQLQRIKRRLEEIHSMSASIDPQRLENLESNIEDAIELLHEYEEERDLQSDRRKIKYYEKNIARQKELIAGYKQQYYDIKKQASERNIEMPHPYLSKNIEGLLKPFIVQPVELITNPILYELKISVEATTPDREATIPTQSSDFTQKPVGDYRHLRELLETGKWKEADLETMNIILKITNREKVKWLREKQDIEEITCEDIRIMNNLWRQFSQNQFGFQAQQEIWQEVGGDLSKFDGGTYDKFCDRVGWQVENDWLPSYDDFTFNLNAPKGHLPTLRVSNVSMNSWRSNFRGFLKQASKCLNI